jgi:autotransporter-associated beta strand protein/T5SS/PEP-CTERM-associated repeat protein
MNLSKIPLRALVAFTLAVSFAAPTIQAVDVTDGSVPVIMDVDGTHYVIGATGAYDLYLGGHMRAGDLNAITLTIQQGSILTGDWGEIGYGSTAAATGGSSVLVTGPGSQWIMANGLYVGRNAANNTLTIADGALVSTPFSTIGDGGPGDNNTISVTGIGSTFASSGPTFASHGFTYVGYYGLNSRLIIENGGTATTWSTLIGNDYPSSGTVMVTGAGSSWTTTGTSVVGRVSTGRTAAVGGGTGTLLVDDGGLVHADTLEVAQGATSTGTITIASGGTLEVANKLSLGLLAGSTATVNLNAGGTLVIADQGAAAIIGGAGAATFYFAGGTLKVRTDAGGGLLTTSVPMVLSDFSTVDTDGNAAVLAGTLSGTGALAKTGAGALTLAGANTYTGATTVSGGTLAVNGSLASTAVTVASGTTLGGSGLIGGLTTFASGAHLAPGNSPGTLTFADGLTLNAGAILDFQLGSGSDLIDITGGMLSGPGTVGGATFNLFDAGGFQAGTYLLMDFTAAAGTSGFGADSFALGSSIAGYDYDFALVGNTLQLTATAIPEPSTYAVLAGLAALGLAIRRRRPVREVKP